MAMAAMLDLIERVTASLKNLNAYPWFPYLTDELVGMGWRTLERDIGLTPLNYGTARVLMGDANAPRNVVTSLSTHLDDKGFKATVPIEFLPRDIALYYEDMGVSFYTVQELTGTNVLSCFEDAFSILKQVPTLLTTIATLVKSLHIIKPESDDYDISFSKPYIPFSIFVSVPQGNNSTRALRVAEAVVHEAMHLQLTLIEKVVRLIDSANEKYFSPWREEFRTAQGVLHALYVFRVIDRFLEEFQTRSSSTGYSEYVQRRRCDITQQIREVESFEGCLDLSPLGRSFVNELLNNRSSCIKSTSRLINLEPLS
jgi:hypothetical protein